MLAVSDYYCVGLPDSARFEGKAPGTSTRGFSFSYKGEIICQDTRLSRSLLPLESGDVSIKAGRGDVCVPIFKKGSSAILHQDQCPLIPTDAPAYRAQRYIPPNGSFLEQLKSC